MMRFRNNLILIFSVLVIISCSGKKHFIIPQRKMASILVDLHLADEIAMNRYSFGNKTDLDSANLYGWVFKKYDITKAEFDSSIVYYAGKSDALNKIYNVVSDRVSKMEADVAKSEEELSKKNIIFEDKKIHKLPFESKRDKIPFDVPISGKGVYTVSAKIILQSIDQSVNPHITAYFWYNDSTEQGVRDYFRQLPIKKTNRPEIFSVSRNLSDPKFTNLRGYILDDDNTDTTYIKYAIVFNLVITK